MTAQVLLTACYEQMLGLRPRNGSLEGGHQSLAQTAPANRKIED